MTGSRHSFCSPASEGHRTRKGKAFHPLRSRLRGPARRELPTESGSDGGQAGRMPSHGSEPPDDPDASTAAWLACRPRVRRASPSGVGRVSASLIVGSVDRVPVKSHSRRGQSIPAVAPWDRTVGRDSAIQKKPENLPTPIIYSRATKRSRREASVQKHFGGRRRHGHRGEQITTLNRDRDNLPWPKSRDPPVDPV